MTAWFDMRIPSAVIVLFIAGFAATELRAADIDLTTALTTRSQTGLFANVYSSGVDAEIGRDTGIVSSQVALTPRLLLSLSDGRTTFQTSYQLDLSNSVVRQGQFALNLYQQINLEFTNQLTHTLSFVINSYGNIGMLDYNGALSVFDADADIAANPPSVSELRFFNASISTVLTKRLSPRDNGTMTVLYLTRRPFGYDDNEMTPFSTQDEVSAAFGYNRSLSRRSRLELEVSGALVLHSPGVDFIPVAAILGCEFRLSETATLRASAGPVMVEQLGIDLFETGEDDVQQGESYLYWLPRANLSYQKRFNLRERKSLAVDITGGLDAYFDPVTASTRQQLQIGLALTLRLSSEWAVVARGGVSSLWLPRGAPVEAEAGAPIIDYPTNAQVSLDATYEISREIELQFGLLSNARMAHMWDSEFRARAFEEFFFVITVQAARNHLE